uniref:Uncharacterized protein n=1 Tax=Kalanchoe fedtschenkoi TaxID=63787 RepID=A0A7N0ZRM1_KALFE
MSVVSTLLWKVGFVSPVSFIDHMASRIVFESLSCQGEFQRRCKAVHHCVLYGPVDDGSFSSWKQRPDA